MTATLSKETTTLFAYDGSGSTGGSVRYHNAAQRLYQELPVDTTQILFWDSTVRIISATELHEINTSRRGAGGTVPSSIATFIRDNDFHGHIVLLTDGQVSSTQVDACDSILPSDWHFASVRVLLVNTGGTINLSVSCPFTRNSPHTVHQLTNGTGLNLSEATQLTTVSPDMLELLNRLDSIHCLSDWSEALAAGLEQVIIARTMGKTGDPTLRDKLLALKARIQRTAALSKGASETVVALRGALEANNERVALDLAATLTEEYYGDDDLSWSGQLNRLVSMCEGALRGTFDLSNVAGAIQSDRARRAATAAPAPTTSAELSEPMVMGDFTSASTFVCPITLDTESDVVLMIAADTHPILGDGLDKDAVTAMANCPLNIFRHPEVLERLKARVDHPLSLRALKEAEGTGGLAESPLTRRPLLGGICLGPFPDHVAATNWTLAQLTADGKRIGNPDLWFAALWLLARRGTLPYLTPVLPQMTAHLIYRLRTSMAPLSLLGTPEFPTTRVPLDVAVWYAVSSSAMTPQPPPAREVVRAHLPYLEELLEIAELTGYRLPTNVPRHLTRLRVAMSMLAAVKRSGAYTLFLSMIRSLYQAAIRQERVCPESGKLLTYWLPIDGPAPYSQQEVVMAAMPAFYRTLSPAEIVAISARVSPLKSGSDVAIPYEWSATELVMPSYRTIWAYGLREFPAASVAICPATCRPYYHVPPTGREWSDVASEIHGIPASAMLSIHTEYGRYVVKHGAFPTKQELLLHLWHRVNGQGHTTLPHQTESFVDDVLADFRPLVAELTPAEFARLFQASVKRTDRIRMEEH